MTNDEIRKKSEARMTKEKHQISPALGIRHSGFALPSDFGFRISDFFRHSSFVIRHSA